MDLVYAIGGCGFLAWLIYLFITRARNRWHILSEYQRGIIYRYGKPFKDVGPGIHKLRIGRDYLVFIDVRPEGFNRDLTAVSTLDGRTAVYSVAGKIQVQDVRKAIYCARNYQQAALAKTISMVRRMLNDYESEDIRRHTQAVCDNITQAVQDSVGKIGMAVFDFRLNQLQIVEGPSGTTGNSGGASA
jgi:regulator of protease activity HflC (stomatin/prohibitin superfamily)